MVVRLDRVRGGGWRVESGGGTASNDKRRENHSVHLELASRSTRRRRKRSGDGGGWLGGGGVDGLPDEEVLRLRACPSHQPRVS